LGLAGAYDLPVQRLKRFFFWMLGPVERTEPDLSSNWTAFWLVLITGLGMYLGDRRDVSGPPLFYGAWRLAVHGGLALTAVVLVERPCSRVLAILGALMCTTPVLIRLVTQSAQHLHAIPEGLFVALCSVGVVLLLGSLGVDGRARWGVGLGRLRWWFPRMGLVLLGLIPFIHIAAFIFPSLVRFYPTHSAARWSLVEFAIAHTGIGLDFIGWELLFRGVLLFGLARRGDPWLAILAQALPFFVLHHAKPDIELVASLVGGILAGWFAWGARSYLPLLVLHWAQITLMGSAGNWVRSLRQLH
jgi:membrane protease YdiL (CAAX protease family)